MVMALRKRVGTVRRSPSPSPSPSRSPVSKKKKSRKSPKPARGRRVRAAESGSESGSEKENESTTGYEKFREERIRENRERMEKLGILSLSSQMFDSKNKRGPPPKTLVKKKRSPPLLPRSYEPRRSSRLKNSTSFEDERSLKNMGITIPDSWKAEVYTEEDEKLLGDCETPWTLNVDGLGEDGEPLYDPVNGTSCHQCRQKTLRKHTFCSKCRSGQGQLCGDCLYTRYGENVMEARENPVWLCPACRGICNCSRCRRAKGWPPVTILYPKVIESGFKSAAHYLIQTRLAGNKPGEPEDGTVVIDLTEGQTPAQLDNECSDTSEWCKSESESESESDDSDGDVSKLTKHKEQAIEKQDGATEVTSGPADRTGVLQEMIVSGGFDCPLLAGI
ncbi:hypothetical protein Cgig2_032460 [Carnegiea gigantea]|uniref:Zinc-finger domain-containing protein n=1 Tax=Carnegiea gigantea TaxID=171969 RepID=A0A9Q1KXF0_9CARY|nr:hypothetical protein Cgig2_032460 [Carnegiea gigantea]